MNKPEILEYHENLASLLNPEPNRAERRAFLAEERKTPEYQVAKREAMNRNHPAYSGEEQLVDRVLNPIFDLIRITRTNEIAKWAEETLVTFNSLPEQTGQERRMVRKLVTQTAKRLLQNPQDISIAEKAWETNGTEQDEPQKPQEPFSKLVRKECLALIKDKWEDIAPGQLAQLVKIYANNDPSQDDAREMLRNYFRGPNSRNQRIEAYYTFVSATLDLVGEDEAFLEGMKIVLHATDILPKDPSLAEQVVLVSLPYKEEAALRKTLVLSYIINQLRFMGLQDFGKYYQDRNDFVGSVAVREEFRKKQIRVAKAMKHDKARELNDKMLIFFRTITTPLSEKRKQELMGTWPFDKAFDENDPLNKKFKEVFPQKDKSHSKTP